MRSLQRQGYLDKVDVLENHKRRTMRQIHLCNNRGHKCSEAVSVFPDDGLDVETLIRNADAAMYQAKKNGRQTYRFFSRNMDAPTMSTKPARRICNSLWNATN
jgi:predicted acylesterase/phospholipase RssA